MHGAGDRRPVDWLAEHDGDSRIERNVGLPVGRVGAYEPGWMAARHDRELGRDYSGATTDLDLESVAYSRGECCGVEATVHHRHREHLSRGDAADRGIFTA